AGFNRGVEFTVDDSGLSGQTHGNAPDGSMWLSQGSFGGGQDPHVAAADGLLADVVYDLGDTYDLEKLHVWNYNEGAGSATRGVNQVELLVSTDIDDPFVSLGTFNFSPATGLTDETGEDIDLSTFTDADFVRRVQLNVISSHGGDNDFAGLSEIRFFGEHIPEPKIPTVSVDEVSSETAGLNRLAIYTIDESGLSNGGHGIVPDGSMWLSQGTFQGIEDPHVAAGDGLIAHITYNLGDVYELERIHLWNYNEDLPNRPELLGRGVNEVEVFVSPAVGQPFVSLGTVNVAQADGSLSYTGEEFDVRLFPQTDRVELIRFDIVSNHGGDLSFVGLSEIQFFGDLIVNSDPVADAGGPYDIVEGADLVLDASGSTDIDFDSLTYSWDINGDGDFSDATGPTPTLNWAALNALVPTIDDSGSFTVTVRADDGVGGSNDASAALTINNVAPAIVVSGDAGGNEGAAVTLNLGALTDPGNDTVSDWAVNWGDGNTESFAAGGDVTHTYADDGTYTALVSLTDEDGTYADVASHDFTIANVAPGISLAADAAVNEGVALTLNLGTVTDPGDDTVTDWVVDWGDGSSETFNAGGDVTHVYDDNGTSTVSVSLVDEDGTFADVASHTVTVNNVAPTAAITGPVDGVPNLTLDFEFWAMDPSVADQNAGFTFAINWGDGATDTLGPAAASPAPTSHSYAQLGDYSISVTATDKDSGVSSVAIYGIEIVPVAKIGNDVFIGGIDGQSNRIIVQSAGPDEVFVRYNDRRYGGFDVSPSSLVSIIGGDGVDRISITNCIASVIDAQAGNDIISASSCDDTIHGGDGRDTILAGEGNNVVDGGAGNDLIQGRSGDDVFYGGSGNDTLAGGSGSDALFGDEGNDRITGGGGHDLLVGGIGNDILVGGSGRDVLLGGFGSDLLRGSDGDDLLVGGQGGDSILGNRGSDVLIDGEAENEADDVALQAVLLNWSVSHIHDFLGALSSDADRDALNGGGGLDELFVGSEDTILNNRGRDAVNTI
ncbi:MAG: Ca2+-binding RTX toxin-like protein, partial [Pirellulaceae bacterium]